LWESWDGWCFLIYLLFVNMKAPNKLIINLSINWFFFLKFLLYQTIFSKQSWHLFKTGLVNFYLSAMCKKIMQSQKKEITREVRIFFINWALCFSFCLWLSSLVIVAFYAWGQTKQIIFNFTLFCWHKIEEVKTIYWLS
jgi:hypothetical protein